jgi:hypothetical protein
MLNTEVARRCESKLGLGEFPMVRRRLYSRLQRVCQQKGDIPLRIVSEVLMEAESLRDRNNGGPASAASKGKWFSKAVVARLTEAGYWTDSSPNQTQEQAREAQKQVDRVKDSFLKPHVEGW